MVYDNNRAVLRGSITKPFVLINIYDTAAFYMTEITVERLNGYKDQIPVMVSDKLVDISGNYLGTFVEITGEYRSYNERQGAETHLVLYVFAKGWNIINGESVYMNRIVLQGFICKPTIHRRTPLGREITDLIVAVNRGKGQSAYIPCICWGRNAGLAADFHVGDGIKLTGRIQSRKYDKRNDTEIKTMTAYEVSANSVEYI